MERGRDLSTEKPAELTPVTPISSTRVSVASQKALRSIQSSSLRYGFDVSHIETSAKDCFRQSNEYILSYT